MPCANVEWISQHASHALTASSLPLAQAFGFPVYEPAVTADMLTDKFLSQMELPPSERCCRGAFNFHSQLCACDPETILAIRNLLLFDPKVTVPFARFLYGDVCGVPVVLDDDCPKGSPFEILQNQIGH